MKVLLFLTIGILVIVLFAIFLVRQRRGTLKNINGSYIVVTDKVEAVGGPKLPEGIEYRFYERYHRPNYSYSSYNQLSIAWNGSKWIETVLTYGDPADNLRHAAESLYESFNGAYTTHLRQEELKKFLSGEGMKTIGDKQQWVDD